METTSSCRTRQTSPPDSDRRDPDLVAAGIPRCRLPAVLLAHVAPFPDLRARDRSDGSEDGHGPSARLETIAGVAHATADGLESPDDENRTSRGRNAPRSFSHGEGSSRPRLVSLLPWSIRPGG